MKSAILYASLKVWSAHSVPVTLPTGEVVFIRAERVDRHYSLAASKARPIGDERVLAAVSLES